MRPQLGSPDAKTANQKPKPEDLTEAPMPEGYDPSQKGDKPPTVYVASLDTFGSKRINNIILKDFLGKELDEWIQLGMAGSADALTKEQEITDKIKKKFGFSDANWSIVQFFEPGRLAVHITLDVVEPGEAKTRMPFLPEPQQAFADPDGLIENWQSYENTALSLVERGELAPDTTKCVAFHCPFGHKHPHLKKYESIFVNGVKKNQTQLAQILQNDKRPMYRGAAAFLLAYMKDGKKLVDLMLSRVKDPEAFVRNNVLRVLGHVAEFHPEYIIPIRPILPALQFPRVSDRSKSMFVVYAQAQSSAKTRDVILKSGAVPSLISIIQSKQPDQRELAHRVLRKISAKDYPVDDAQSWKNWYATYEKDLGRK